MDATRKKAFPRNALNQKPMIDLRFAIRHFSNRPASRCSPSYPRARHWRQHRHLQSRPRSFLRGSRFRSRPRRPAYGEAKERDLDSCLSVPALLAYRDGQSVFTEMAADAGMGYIVTGLGEPLQTFGANVTANYFEMLGVRPIRGRNSCRRRRWRRRGGDHGNVLAQPPNSDPNVIGTNLTLNASPPRSLGSFRSCRFPVRPKLRHLHVKPFTGRRDARSADARVSFMRAIGRLNPASVRNKRRPDERLHQGYKQERPDAADNTG